MLIGGVAVAARGVRRLTDDVDATIWGEGVGFNDLLGRLERVGSLPRIRGALTFARRNQVLLLRQEPSGVDIELTSHGCPPRALRSIARLPFEGLDRARRRIPQ
jgi:hypothetical protein